MTAWIAEIEKIQAGQRILILCGSRDEAKEQASELVLECPTLILQSSCSMVRCESGGLAHFVWRDDQTIGMKYDAAMGPRVKVTGIPPAMAARVRPHKATP